MVVMPDHGTVAVAQPLHHSGLCNPLRVGARRTEIVPEAVHGPCTNPVEPAGVGNVGASAARTSRTSAFRTISRLETLSTEGKRCPRPADWVSASSPTNTCVQPLDAPPA